MLICISFPSVRRMRCATLAAIGYCGNGAGSERFVLNAATH